MEQLNQQAQDLVDAGHVDPNAVEETRIVMEERFVANNNKCSAVTVRRRLDHLVLLYLNTYRVR